MPRTRARVRWFRALLALVLSPLLALLLLEVAVRLLGNADFHGVDYVVEDPELQWRNAPSKSSSIVGFDYRFRISFNSLGLRGPEPKPAERRLLVLGDSYTLGLGVDDDATFSARLQARADAARPGTLDVQDAGVAGYGVLQETKLAERLWPALQPALVLYVHCGNDFSDDWNFTHGSWGSLRSALPGRQFLQQHSAAWSLLKPGALALLSALSIRRGTLRIEGGEEATLVSELGARWAEGRDLTLAGLGALDEWCRAHGARLLVTSVGFRHEAGPDGPELLSRDALAVRDACSARGIPFLGPPAPRADRPASAWTNHSTIGHWTPDGHAWFAEFLFASLPD